ncbi:MAG: hypothetical protein AAFR65_11200 [Pseudomonadota bacterium]
MYIELCAADHVQDGFVYLARWDRADEATCQSALDAVDELIDPEAEPDTQTEDYTFILDLYDSKDDLVGNNKRNLPLQIAMRLAPDQVSQWLKERPDPDALALAGYEPPCLSGQPH